MNNEEFLLTELEKSIRWIDSYIYWTKNIPEDFQISGYDDGKLAGLIHGLSALNRILKNYEDKKKGEAHVIPTK